MNKNVKNSGWWLDRNGKSQNFWGGAVNADQGCACGITGKKDSSINLILKNATRKSRNKLFNI